MPTRYLKPGVRDSAAIDALSPLAETLFYRLLVTVDDFGRADARPAMVKSQCYPVKESVTVAKCVQLLAELAENGLILLYEVDGKQYLQMQKWDNKPRAAASMFPAPADGCMQTYTSVCKPRTNLPVTVTVTGTETGTGDSAAAQSAAPPPAAFNGENLEQIPGRQIIPLAAGWALPDDWGQDAERLGWPSRDILHEAEKFRQYWTAGKGMGTRRSVKGWRQSWSNWIAKAAQRR